MKLRSLLQITACGLLLVACESKEQAEQDAAAAPTPEEILAKTPEQHGTKIESVELTHPLKQEWITQGKGIYGPSRALPGAPGPPAAPSARDLSF